MSVFSFFAKHSYDIPDGDYNMCSYKENICLFVYLFKYKERIYKLYLIEKDEEEKEKEGEIY
jgi:hypothetical protein